MNPDFHNHGNSIWNQPFIDHLNENFWPNIDPGHLPEQADKFLELYPDWIASSKLNQFRGLEGFEHKFVSLGATQGLDWWHYWCMANGYRLRMYRGEYPYNRDVLLEGQWTHDRFIGDRPLAKGDAVIISLPFSGSGRKPDKWKQLMHTCNENNIPVFVDCAWFGTCTDIEVKLNQDCIKMVAFSTTKGLSCGNWRAGIVFSRLNEGSLAVQTEWHHGIHLNCAIANSLMENFSPDTMPKKYAEAHTAVCDYYGLATTNTIHIAQAPMTEDWNQFSRDGAFNRVNIRDALKRYKKNGTFAQ